MMNWGRCWIASENPHASYQKKASDLSALMMFFSQQAGQPMTSPV